MRLEPNQTRTEEKEAEHKRKTEREMRVKKGGGHREELQISTVL